MPSLCIVVIRSCRFLFSFQLIQVFLLHTHTHSSVHHPSTAVSIFFWLFVYFIDVAFPIRYFSCFFFHQLLGIGCFFAYSCTFAASQMVSCRRFCRFRMFRGALPCVMKNDVWWEFGSELCTYFRCIWFLLYRCRSSLLARSVSLLFTNLSYFAADSDAFPMRCSRPLRAYGEPTPFCTFFSSLVVVSETQPPRHLDFTIHQTLSPFAILCDKYTKSINKRRVKYQQFSQYYVRSTVKAYFSRFFYYCYLVERWLNCCKNAYMRVL